MKTQKKCESCEGTGQDLVSCCNDDIRDTDNDLCPTCKEHTGGECNDCQGSGIERKTFYVQFKVKTEKGIIDKEMRAYGNTEEEAKIAVTQYLKRRKIELVN